MKSTANFRKNSRRSRGRKRRLIAIVIALCAVAALLVFFRPKAHLAARPEPVTRTPGAAAPYDGTSWTTAQRAAAHRAIESALGPATRNADAVSAIVLDHDGNRLFSDSPATAVMPASTLKLVVANAALAKRGRSYAFRTIFAATQPVQDGVLHGNLYVAGSGDPSLRSSDLVRGIRALQESGLRRIDGNLVIDGTAIAGEEINPLWNADDVNEDFNAATSGISLDEDTVEFHITGTVPGAPATVFLNPRSSTVHYSGSITTSSGGDDVVIGGEMLPNEFHLSGVIPPGVRETFYLPVHGIPQYVAGVMSRMLRDAGIQLDGARTGSTPLDSHVLWTRRSPPLSVLVRHMLVHSDNHYAEQLMRTLDESNTTDAGGVAAELAYLRDANIPRAGIHLVDGSGLARANRISADTLSAILLHAEHSEGGNALYPLLARGGFDGTLRHYTFGASRGRVRAKSGHLADVASLAGYLDTAHHGRLVFAFLIDGSRGDPDRAIVNALDRLAQF